MLNVISYVRDRSKSILNSILADDLPVIGHTDMKSLKRLQQAAINAGISIEKFNKKAGGAGKIAEK